MGEQAASRFLPQGAVLALLGFLDYIIDSVSEKVQQKRGEL
jgi:hypothetical protein